MEDKPKEDASVSKKLFLNISRAILYFFDAAIDSASINLRIIIKNINLFFGFALLLIGVFSFNSDKYCDGNTANYLSCTRPTTYYYYEGWDVALIVAGISLILIWFLKRK